MMAGDQLARYRAAVDDGHSGPALEGIVAGLRDEGLEVAGEALKVAPRGYPRDHPRVDLLRHKSLAAVRRYPPERWLGTPAAATRVTAVWRAAAPLTRWLAAHVGPGDGTDGRRRR
ncbi:MAG TPA: DUF2461 family protein, partial [Acidimicrobiales bacterium]|nr:DUF2461 family protein [Acidimicrobiales bacterium]